MYQQKILLISLKTTAYFNNAGIDQLAYYLRKRNKNVTLLYFHEDNSIEEILAKVRLNYDIYGISLDLEGLAKGFQIAEHIKKYDANKTVCYGGVFPTVMYREILDDCKYVDYIILGDGEIPFNHLVDNLGTSDFKEYHHIASHENIKNKKQSINEISECLQADDYFEGKNGDAYIYCLITKSNCCTGSCTFCFARKSKKTNYRSIDSIVDEIIYKHKKHNIENFYFADYSIFHLKNNEEKNRLHELCGKINSHHVKLSFFCYIKVDSFTNSDEDKALLKKMRETGFGQIFIGIEAGNDSDLKLYNKNCSVADNYRIIELLRRYDIEPYLGFIMFNPYSTIESLRENFIFLKTIKALNIYLYAFCFIAVDKYTPIYNMMMKDKLIVDNHSYKNIFEYAYQHINVEKMALFLKANFAEDIYFKKIQVVDRVNDMFRSMRIRYPVIDIFQEELLRLNEIYFKIVIEFFEKFYVENDLVYCECNVGIFKQKLNEIKNEYTLLKNKIIKTYLHFKTKRKGTVKDG
ncbi:MAG: radical SAM protein [Lachnospiraceae bacterium]|nr:radical SAM protein [Lachnospiraceae bacterium]